MICLIITRIMKDTMDYQDHNVVSFVVLRERCVPSL